MKRFSILFTAVVAAAAAGVARAQSVEIKSGSGLTLNQNSEVIATHLTSAGSVAQNGTSRVALKGDLSNSGTYASSDTAVTEFIGSADQAITSTSTLDLGRLKCSNTSANPAQAVTLHANADVFRIEVADGHLRLCNSTTTVFSPDTASGDPMVAVKAGTILSVEPGATLFLSQGKLFVFSAPSGCGDESGKLVLQGTASQACTIDLRSGAPSRYSTEIQGELSASGFKILRGDAAGLAFKSVAGNDSPLVSKFDNGVFDRGPNGGSYVTLSDGNPVRFNVADSNLLTAMRFDNSDSVATLFNVASTANTKLKDAGGLDLSFVTFSGWSGAKGGETNDNEAGAENKIRWISAPTSTSLSQTKLDGSALAVGGTTADNGVVLKHQSTAADSDGLQLEVEVDPTSLPLTGGGTQPGAAVNGGAAAQVTVYGLANGNYHWRGRVRMGSTLTAWVSFGTNPDGQTDFAISNSNNPPGIPSGANQYKNDGTTVIPTGGDTNEMTVKFKATVSDPDLNTVKLQVEVKPRGVDFDGNASGESALVASGTQVTVTVSGLANGQYVWRYRAIDSFGHAGFWTDFPIFQGYSFQVATVLAPPRIITGGWKSKDNTPLISGTGIAGATLELFANGVSVGTTVVGGTGSWQLSSSSLIDGSYRFTARQTLGGTSGDSNAITVVIDTCPPDPPAAVYATPQNNAVLVEWEPSPSADVFGYHVYRKLSVEPESAYVKLTTSGPVSASSRKYRDATAANGTRYDYKVSAVDDAQDNAPSD
jgi:hypothetical protein